MVSIFICSRIERIVEVIKLQFSWLDAIGFLFLEVVLQKIAKSLDLFILIAVNRLTIM